MGVLQQLRELTPLSLQFIVPTNMLVIDKDVRYRTLAGYVLKGVLDRVAISYTLSVSI
jgi:hypothetical protein